VVKIIDEQFNNRDIKQCGLYRGNKFFIQKSTRTPLIYQTDPSVCEFNHTETTTAYSTTDSTNSTNATNSRDSFQTNKAVFLTTRQGTDCNLENVIDYVESLQPRFAILGTYSTVLVKNIRKKRFPKYKFYLIKIFLRKEIIITLL